MASGYLRRFSGIWRHLLFLLLLVHLQPTACACMPKEELIESRGSMWDWVSFLPLLLDGSQFTNLAEPLLQMCTNAYNFQYHVIPYKEDHLIPIKDWSVSLKVPPAAPLREGAGGMHALVYEEGPILLKDHPQRVVLVFRGWQTSSSSLDTLADLCAGQLLFPNYVDFLSPPSLLCSALFNAPTLDYLSQAIAYTHLVLQSYPPSSVLLTGHGFGGGLAVLVSAALQQQQHGCHSSNKVGGLTSLSAGIYRSCQHSKRHSCSGLRLPAVSFSGPGTLQDLYHWGWMLNDSHDIITISHQWDFFSVRAQWKDHLGWLCLYKKQEPASCKACFSDEQRLSSPEVVKPMASVDGVFKDKEKNNDHDDDHNDKDKDDNDQGDDDDCPYDDEPCWDCLSDTYAPESLLAVMEERSRPSCVFLGGPNVSALSQKPERSRLAASMPSPEL